MNDKDDVSECRGPAPGSLREPWPAALVPVLPGPLLSAFSR